MIDTILFYVGVIVIRSFDKLIAACTANRPVLSKEEFPFYESLKNNHRALLAEYEASNNERMESINQFFRGKYSLVDDDSWLATPIILFGYRFVENVQRYPETYRLVSQMPGCCGAMISVLEKGKHIPPHVGIYKGIYRCLFTLKVQQDAECWIRVGQEKIFFREGECIVFDETVEHEVMNASSEARVVLFLDFYRKLPFPLNYMNTVIFALLRRSAFVKTILEKYKGLGNTTIEDFDITQPQLT